MTTRPCVGCPFRRDCPGCPWTGEPVATQADSSVSAGQEGSSSRILRGQEAAPEQRANTAEGLTTKTEMESQWL